jgi:predicted adenylyl cyclase CyaB
MENLIKKANAVFKGILKQKDIYYEYKKGLLKLRIENGDYHLIKYLRDEKGKRWSNYEIVKLEGKNVTKYLSGILTVEAVVEKTRKLYVYKDTRIHLDDVKTLGKFLELETVVTKDKASAEKEFAHVVKMLNLDTAKQIKSSYRNLLVK